MDTDNAHLRNHLKTDRISPTTKCREEATSKRAGRVETRSELNEFAPPAMGGRQPKAQRRERKRRPTPGRPHRENESP